MLLNILEIILLFIFMICTACVLNLSRGISPGLIIWDSEDKKLTSGKQGMETAVGRTFSSDVRIKGSDVEKNHALLSYNAKKNCYTADHFNLRYRIENEYSIADRTLHITLPYFEELFRFGFAPALIAVIFILVRMLVTFEDFGSVMTLVPYGILVLFLVLSLILRSDTFPVIESVFAVMLTYYIDAMLYYSIGDPSRFDSDISSAIVGVALYCICFMAAKFFFSLDLNRKKLHSKLRLLATLAILALFAVNYLFRSKVYGAYNWVNIMGFGFQPSELIKLLFIFVMVVPSGEKFYSFPNLIYVTVLPMACFAYAILIRDIGVLLLFGVIYMTAILVQCRNFFYSLLHILGAVIGCQAVLAISSTAAYRFYGWFSGSGVWASLTSAGVFDDPSDYGYQPLRALVAAVKNGGLFGSENSIDMLKGITAANSDLVSAVIAQSSGILVLFAFIIIYLLLFGASSLSIRQQRKPQQMMTLLCLVCITSAMLLNIGGTFGILPLTGIVNPCLSAGISASVSYGAMFGMIACSSMSRKYFRAIKELTVEPEQNETE